MMRLYVGQEGKGGEGRGDKEKREGEGEGGKTQICTNASYQICM
jgi:hypothetical protein